MRTLLRSANVTRLAALMSISAFFGPPHIKVREVPTSASNGNAVFELDVVHHTTPEDMSVTGRAEGVRDGKRVTLPLTLAHKATGVYAVTKQWDAGRPWVLVFSVQQGPDGKHGVAEAVVSVDASGAVKKIDYLEPGFLQSTKQPLRVTKERVDDVLRELGAFKPK